MLQTELNTEQLNKLSFTFSANPTYEYVIEMLTDIFGHSPQTAFEMALTVDTQKKVAVYTTYKERAEQKKRQIENYGADWRIPSCKGSMSTYIEPA